MLFWMRRIISAPPGKGQKMLCINRAISLRFAPPTA